MNKLGALFISRRQSTIDCSVIKENYKKMNVGD
jgi:hypothetical protein